MLPHPRVNKARVQPASTGPRDPPTPPNKQRPHSQTLLTSLSLCEGKVQSCILANGKRRISGERDGPLSLQRGPSDEPPFLLGNMVGTRGRLGSDSPLLLTRSSLALALAAVVARGVRSLQVSHAPLWHLLTSPHISCLSLSPMLLGLSCHLSQLQTPRSN